MKAKKKKQEQGIIAKVSKPQRNGKGQLLHGWGQGSKQVKKKALPSMHIHAAQIKKKKKKKKALRGYHGRLLPGTPSLNPGGGPRGSKINTLMAAIADVQNARGKDWLMHQIEKSYDDTSLAICLLNRLYPALRAVEMLTLPGDLIPDEEAEKWREEFNQRFHSGDNGNDEQ